MVSFFRSLIQEGTWAYASVSTQLSALSSYFVIVLAHFLTGSLSQTYFPSSEEVVSGYFTRSFSTSALPWDPFSTAATQHTPSLFLLSLCPDHPFPSSPCSAPAFLVRNPSHSFLTRLCTCWLFSRVLCLLSRRRIYSSPLR